MIKKKEKIIIEKYVTEKGFKNTFSNFEARFENSARDTAKSFADNAEVMALILKEIRTIHEDNKYFRQSISSLNTDGSSHDKKIENLTVRVEKLEVKAR